MEEEQENFDYKKSSIALFVIIAAILVAVLLIEWLFTLLKGKM